MNPIAIALSFFTTFLLMWPFYLQHAYAQEMEGKPDMKRGYPFAQPIGGRDEQVEGCFNNFDAQISFPLPPENLSNLRCQALCRERGYALAATGGGANSTCGCGNLYPGSLHAVANGQCNRPCSLDKSSCYLFTCCGNRNGTLYTVSWNGEANPLKQLLRRLTHDYSKNTAFRRQVEETYLAGGERASLQLREPGHGAEGPPLYLSVGNGCPVGWRMHEGYCYKQHWAEPSTYNEACAKCQSKGAELVTVMSISENGFVQDLYGGCQGWLHDRSSLEGKHSPASPETHECLQLARDGSWINKSCQGEEDDKEEEERASCFACKKFCASPYPSLRPLEAEEWAIEIVTPTSSVYRWCADCTDTFLKSINSNQYLCADDQHRPYLSWERDVTWCLWTLVVDPESGAVVLLTPHGAALAYDKERSALVCQLLLWSYKTPPPPGSVKRLFSEVGLEAPQGTIVLNPSSLPLVIAERYLRVTIHSINRRPEVFGFASNRSGNGPLRECSMAVCDTSPQSESFSCRPLSGPGVGYTPLIFNQVALHVFDQSSYVSARQPLPNGRLTCLNQNPTETVNCVFSYGESFILVHRFRANWGVQLFDTVSKLFEVTQLDDLTVQYQGAGQTGRDRTEGAGGGQVAKAGVGSRGVAAGRVRGVRGRAGGGTTDSGGRRAREFGGPNRVQFMNRNSKLVQNALTGAFDTFYQVINLKILVEVRNWQLGLNVVPQTALTIQYWLTMHYLKYRWRAVFQPQGGFVLTLFGRQIGGENGCNFSLGDLSAAQDLLFSMYGTYEEPIEAGVTMTDIEHIELSYLGLPVQPWTDEGLERGT